MICCGRVSTRDIEVLCRVLGVRDFIPTLQAQCGSSMPPCLTRVRALVQLCLHSKRAGGLDFELAERSNNSRVQLQCKDLADKVRILDVRRQSHACARL